VKKIEEELTTYYEGKRYCRVRIGDTLGKRYHILGKLGYGQVSTVWFARNVEYVILLAFALSSNYHSGISNGCRSKCARK